MAGILSMEEPVFNFAYGGSELLGQFNGRFAYHASRTGEELPVATFNEFRDLGLSALDDKALRHECLHWWVFQHSILGIEIIGRRFRARKAYTRGKLPPVLDYYAVRTIYLHYAFNAHEDVVKLIEDKLEASPLVVPVVDPLAALRAAPWDAELQKRLDFADQNALEVMSEFGLVPPPLLRVLDRERGKRATQEVGLQSYYSGATGPQLRETSMAGGTGGIVNAAFEQRKESLARHIFKWVRRRLNTERNFTLTDERLAKWALLKYRSELTTLQRIRECDLSSPAPDPTDRYKREARRTVEFVLLHTLQKEDAMFICEIADTIVMAAKTDAPWENPDLVRYFAKRGQPFLYFFYNHGN